MQSPYQPSNSANPATMQSDISSERAAYSCHPISSSDCSIYRQIDEAFKSSPDISLTLHGQRRIKQGNRGHRTALFPSRKAGGTIPLESKLELAYTIELERNPAVSNYRTQAIKISINKHSYLTPDFLIKNIDGSIEIHEVKPSIDHLTDDQIEKFTRVQFILAEKGIAFKIIDSKSLVKGAALDNLIHMYARGHIKAWTSSQIIQASNALKNINPHSLDAYKILANEDLPTQLADYLWFHQSKNWGLQK